MKRALSVFLACMILFSCVAALAESGRKTFTNHGFTAELPDWTPEEGDNGTVHFIKLRRDPQHSAKGMYTFNVSRATTVLDPDQYYSLFLGSLGYEDMEITDITVCGAPAKLFTGKVTQGALTVTLCGFACVIGNKVISTLYIDPTVSDSELEKDVKKVAASVLLD